MGTPGVFPSFVNVVVSSPWFFFPILFLCLCHSTFHQVGNGEHVSEYPAQESYFQTCCLWLPLEHCRPITLSRRELSLGVALSAQCHWCPYSSTAEHCIRWVTYQFRAWTGNIFCFQLHWCNSCLFGFLRVVHFSLNDRHFNTYPMGQLSSLRESEQWRELAGGQLLHLLQSSWMTLHKPFDLFMPQSVLLCRQERKEPPRHSPRSCTVREDAPLCRDELLLCLDITKVWSQQALETTYCK